MAEIKTKLLFDGYAQYKSELTNITQQSKVLAAEMKAVTSSFNSSTTAQQRNEAVSSQLRSQIEQQKDVIAKLEEGIKRATDAGHGNETQTLKWKEQLANANATLNSLEDELGNVGKEEEKVTQTTSTFGSVLKANLASEAIIAGVKALGNAMVAIGKGIFNLGKDSVNAFADFEQLQGGVNKIFGDDAQTVIENASKAFKTAGVSANEYMESVTGFSASLINSLGGDTAQAASLADVALRDMADNANTYGTDLSSIQSAYQGFAKQTYTMLDNLKLGYGGTKTEMERLLKDANEYNKQQGKNTDYQIENYADIIKAIHDIQEAQGIMGTTEKEAANTISGSLNQLKGAWENLLAGFANPDADVEGLGRKVVASLRDVMKNLTPVINSIISAIPTLIQELGPAFQALVPEFLANIAPMIPEIVNGIVEMLPVIIPLAVQIITTINQALLENAPLLLQAAGQLLLGLAQGFIQLAPTLITSGMDLMVQLGNGIWGGLVELYTKLNGWLMDNLVNPAREMVQSFISIGGDIVAGFWQGIKDKTSWLKNMIVGWVGDVKDWLKNLFGVHSPSTYTEWIGKMLGEGLANGIYNTRGLVNRAWEASFGMPNANITAASPKVVNLTVNSTTLTESQTDYLIARINSEFGSAV